MSFLVSIIVPCYNQAQFLPETLQSVLDQTYTHWECIIINDGSPDNTEEVALEWCKKDERFVYFKKENGGLSSARNAGLKIAIGDFIQFLDSDDLLNSFKLERQLNCFNNSIDIVICDYFPFNQITKAFQRSRYITPFVSEDNFMSDIISKWETELTIPCHCPLFRREILVENSLHFNEDLPNHEDWCFWVALFYYSKNIYNLNEVLVSYRIHNNGMCADDKKMKEGFIMASEMNIVFFNSLNNKPLKVLCEQKNNQVKGIIDNQTFHFKSFLALFIPPILFLLKNKFFKR